MIHRTWEEIEGLLAAGKDVAVVTVEGISGSSPAAPGAVMGITRSGPPAGTVGGGALEARAQTLAEDVLKTGISRSALFWLRDASAASLGMICGGRTALDLRYLAAQDPAAADWIAVQRKRAREAAPRVYVFGGGHVAQAVVPLLASVGFCPIVVEDRPEFADPRLFPDAEETRVVDMHRLDAEIHLEPEDYVLIVTRGHTNDRIAQAYAMRHHPAYIGVIGSKKKTREVTEKLRTDGFSETDFRNVFAPVGIPIGSRTPEEISVSIVGQLILVRRKGIEAARRLCAQTA